MKYTAVSYESQYRSDKFGTLWSYMRHTYVEFLHLLKALKRNYKVNVTLPIVCLCECSEYLSILEKIKVHVNQSQWQLWFLGLVVAN